MTITVCSSSFVPTRAAGLARLAAFLPHAGRAYASDRNTDRGPEDRSNVSVLSPYVRHRLITEQEVVQAVLAQHSLDGSEKFIQEVFWRSYFKGYLESRPSLWQHYQTAFDQKISMTQKGGWMANAYVQATTGETGIDCFDAWVKELMETGYLHNHARMWFASIWIFTLKLPWELGADFTFRHFIDGDPASNTLSWRWVGGLHTKGKTYLARADNIRTYTGGRFDPKGLASFAVPLEESFISTPQKSAVPSTRAPAGPALLLLTEEDLYPESLDLEAAEIRAIVACPAGRERSTLATASPVLAFIDGAINDCIQRASAHFGVSARLMDDLTAENLVRLAKSLQVSRILTAYAPVGPMQDRLALLKPVLARDGINLVMLGRREDQAIWPHATKGFFGLKERIPDLVRSLGMGA